MTRNGTDKMKLEIKEALVQLKKKTTRKERVVLVLKIYKYICELEKGKNNE